MRFFLIRALVAAGMLVGFGTVAGAEPALFAARDADTTIYLFGTSHAVQCDQSDPPVEPGAAGGAGVPAGDGDDCLGWMTDAVRDAFTSADEFWVETVDVGDEALVAALVEELGYLDGTLLTDLMPEQDLQVLAEMIAGPMAARMFPELNAMQPWLVSLLAGVTPMINGGASPDDGVDLMLIDLAEERGIPVRGFETAEAQVRMMSSDPLEIQVAGLRTLVVLQNHGIDLSAMSQWLFGKMWTFWVEGDLESLAFLILGDDEAFFDQFDTEIKVFFDMTEAEIDALDAEISALYGLLDPAERAVSAYNTIVGERNRAWMPAIHDMLDRPGTFFIGVGAGHLTGGAALQTLIAREGVDVTRVQ